LAWIPALGLLLAACAMPTDRARSSPRATATVPERYVSSEVPGEELDSLATWAAPDGRVWLIASGKSSHRLTVFNAETGERLRTVGGPGKAQGSFDRPNGLAVWTNGDDPSGVAGAALLFVVERDNRRVQVLRLPGFEPLTAFGSDVLRSPYGIWLHPIGAHELEAYVTDSFMYGPRFDVVPPLPELSQRVRRFRLRFDGDRLEAVAAGSFGDTTQAGALRMVESLAGDPDNDRLLVADESTTPGDRRSNLREYTLSGGYTGRSLPEGSFDAEAEGVALWPCANGGGYWIAADQLTPLTRFHLFDRRTLAWRGTWTGRVTADTDGIALHTGPTLRFPHGALFAVDKDKAVAAFDLQDVARALGVAADCIR
jgi:3-phytase